MKTVITNGASASPISRMPCVVARCTLLPVPVFLEDADDDVAGISTNDTEDEELDTVPEPDVAEEGAPVSNPVGASGAQAARARAMKEMAESFRIPQLE